MLGRNFRARRLQCGFTIERLAEAAGVDRKSIMRLEHGAQRVDWAIIWSACDALDIELRDLLPFKNDEGELVVEYRWTELIPPDADLGLPRR